LFAVSSNVSRIRKRPAVSDDASSQGNGAALPVRALWHVPHDSTTRLRAALQTMLDAYAHANHALTTTTTLSRPRPHDHALTTTPARPRPHDHAPFSTPHSLDVRLFELSVCSASHALAATLCSPHHTLLTFACSNSPSVWFYLQSLRFLVCFLLWPCAQKTRFIMLTRVCVGAVDPQVRCCIT
jgi:hypothetical protein